MRRLVALDSLRGICALFVVQLHINALSHISQATFVRQSWLFVDFFFVLSGFVIAYAYLDRLATLRDASVFLIRRIGRVWPLHVFVLALMVVSELVKLLLAELGFPVHAPAFQGHYGIDSLIAGIVLVHSMGLFVDDVWNGPSWSISVEFWTYVVFAAVALRAARAVIGTSAVLVALGVGVLTLAQVYLGTSWEYGFFRCLYGFFVGVLIERLFRALDAGGRTVPAATLVEAALVVAVVVLLHASFGRPAVTMLAPPLFAVVVLTFAFQRGRVSALLLTRPFVWIGERSYAIYIVHALLIEQINRGLLMVDHLTGASFIVKTTVGEDSFDVISVHGPWVTDLVVLAYIGAVLVFAHLAHITIEARGRALFNRLAKSVPAMAPGTAD